MSDIVAARDELVARGVPVGAIRHMSDGKMRPGVDPNRSDYMSFADFADPDGNVWLLQERSTPKAGTRGRDSGSRPFGAPMR